MSVHAVVAACRVRLAFNRTEPLFGAMIELASAGVPPVTPESTHMQATGLVARQRRAATAPSPKQRSLPRGSGSYAIIRALVGFSSGEEPGATALAARAGISQPRASQVLHRLHELGLVDTSGHGRWKPRREDLAYRFLAEYPGPGGAELYYSPSIPQSR